MLYKIFIPKDDAWDKAKPECVELQVIRSFQGREVLGTELQVSRVAKILQKVGYVLDVEELQPGDKMPTGDVYVNANGTSIAWTRKAAEGVVTLGRWQFNTQSCIRSKVLVW